MKTCPCESCGVPIAGGPYCQDCVDATTGKLHAFDHRLGRVVAMLSRHDRGAQREQLNRRALAYMAIMPAWKNHPRIKAEFPEPQPR